MKVSSIDALKSKIEEFLSRRLTNIDKWRRKVIPLFFLGIILAGKVILSAIAEKLSKIIETQPKSILNRLSYTLNAPRFKPDNVLSDHIKETMRGFTGRFLALFDTGDICKEYAKKMENVALVRDGSKKRIVNGYWTLDITAIYLNKINHIFTTPFSIENWNTPSMNAYLENATILIHKESGGNAIFIKDRGFGYARWVNFHLEIGSKFIIRMNSHITAEINGKRILLEEIPFSGQYTYKYRCSFQKGNKIIHIDYGIIRNVRLKDTDTGEFTKQGCTLIFARQLYTRKNEALLLLTNFDLDEVHPNWIIQSYHQRWVIEDVIRFAKQSIEYEGFQVEKFHAIQALFVIISLVLSFLIALQTSSPMLLRYLTKDVFVSSNKKIKYWWYRIIKGLRNIFEEFLDEILTECLRAIEDFYLQNKSRKRFRKYDNIIRVKILLGKQSCF